MNIENEILTWALQRPRWQQEVLVALARGETLTDPDRITTVTDRALDPASGSPSDAASKLALGTAAAPRRVRLSRLHDLAGVNALADGQALAFAREGMTVIYGNNGSGKSGYARVIKAMVSARHLSEVLPNVFEASANDPSAELDYQVDDDDASEKFPANPPVPDLQSIRFYDVHCGHEYITKAASVTYRPSALSLLDGLIKVCDLVREDLDRRLSASDAGRLQLELPTDTTAGRFLSGITAATSVDAINAATELPASAADDLGRALREVARLESSDATKERARFERAAAEVGVLASHVRNVASSTSPTSADELLRLRDDAQTKRGAARVAASGSFEAEPLPGVGSEAWRRLWDAARAYATSDAHPGHEFPETDTGAICVLCQQALAESAKDRFRRFERYMTDTTENDASEAEARYEASRAVLRGLEFTTTAATTGIAALNAYDQDLARAVADWLALVEEHREALVRHLDDGESRRPSGVLLGDVASRLDAAAAMKRARAEGTDIAAHAEAIFQAKAQLSELQASSRLAEHRDDLEIEVARLIAHSRLEAAKRLADTTGITRKSSELMHDYATKAIVDHFTRETERLELRRVTLQDLGGRKGKLNQIPALLGAYSRRASAEAVLSEGEQTVLGLAGFFTEVEFDHSASAVIFDDPVTSLDHLRRDKVAVRLAQFARSRQVVVFTHDVAFVGELIKAAASERVQLAARTLQRRGAEPGHCAETFPWKAKDTGARIDELSRLLARLKAERSTLVDADYEERVAAWAGKLSESWEGCVTAEVMDRVFDRGTAEVRPRMFRLFASITAADDTEFQTGYGYTSMWARRHNKADTTNYVPPEVDELERELERLSVWRARIKKYVQTPS